MLREAGRGSTDRWAQENMVEIYLNREHGRESRLTPLSSKTEHLDPLDSRPGRPIACNLLILKDREGVEFTKA